MAKLILISDKLYKPGINEIGDIVSVYEDTKLLSSPSYAIFDIVQIELTKVSVDLLKPQVKRYYKAKSTTWSEEYPEEIECWQDKDGSMKKVTTEPKYKQRYEDGTIKENYSRYEENHTVIVDKDGKVIG